MAQTDRNVSLLRNILENLSTPEQLDDHAWTHSLFTREACLHDAALAALPPGRQLIGAVLQAFRKLRPAMPPKRGLRLDTHWGEFGLLAAQYFAPYAFGLPYPPTLREAWQGIDAAILFFVFDDPNAIPPAERDRYKLVSAEPETAPNSTISDWHRKGLERLAASLDQYERHLETRDAEISPPAAAVAQKKAAGTRRLRLFLGWFARLLLLAVVIVLLAAGWKGWQIYQRALVVREQVQALQGLSPATLDIDQLKAAGQHLSLLRTGLLALQDEAAPLLPLTPYLGWVPVYGGDLTQSAPLLAMGVQLSITGDEAYQAVAPALQTGSGTNRPPQVLDLLTNLKDADSRLLLAQVALSRARTARQQVQLQALSENTRTLLTGKIDPLLLSLQGAFPVDDVLSMARLAPRLLGAVGNGPQTYLILVQNEDELRPTGGFLTAVGAVVIQDGKVQHMTFESSDVVDDLTKPYPAPPWQLQQYMNADMLLLRDANWFTNFPTTVEWVKFLYAYTRSKAVNGVIAVDQHVLVEFLKDIGPIQVQGIDQAITAGNVLQLMRASKQQTPPAGFTGQNWDRKQFIGRLAAPLIQKLLTADRITLQPLSKTMIGLLDEKHVLLQFDDPEMTALLTRRGWDGALRPAPAADFLMLVDSNIGFNKTTSLMHTNLEYRLDLTDPAQPRAQVTVRQANSAKWQEQLAAVGCIQGRQPAIERAAEAEYPVNDCYWSYLRMYTPAGSELQASTPHAIPAHWPLRELAIPARTDTLQEQIPGVQAFGTLVVVPPQQTQVTSFSYNLPPGLLKYDALKRSWTYRLVVQKQPGTLANAFSFSLQLPAGAQLVTAPPGLKKTADGWLWETDLRRDIQLDLVFSLAP